MNEQIEKLADQAEEYAVRVTTGDWEDGLAYQDLFNQKFAELIVRECALTAGLMEHEGRRGIGAQILDNFGVEE